MAYYDQMKQRIETTMVAPTLCIVDQAVIKAYSAGEIDSEQLKSLLAISSRRKIELILGRRGM